MDAKTLELKVDRILAKHSGPDVPNRFRLMAAQMLAKYIAIKPMNELPALFMAVMDGIEDDDMHLEVQDLMDLAAEYRHSWEQRRYGGGSLMR
jgi:hypothetical protein